MARALGMVFTAYAPGIWNDLTLYWFRHHAKRLGLKVFPLFGKLVPGRVAYPLSMVLSKAFGPLVPYPIIWPLFQKRFRRGRLLHFCLATFSGMGKSFEVPFSYHGVDQLLDSHAQHGGVVLCSIHLPLNRSIHGVLLQLQVPTAVVLAQRRANKQYVFGHPKAEAPEALSTGSSLFFQARTALRKGKIVLVCRCRRDEVRLRVGSRWLYRIEDQRFRTRDY